MNARILLVDDHEVVREGLKFLFSDARPEWQVCGEAANSDEAIKQAVASKPDVIILDISMPGVSGLEAVPMMRALGIKAPVLIFTTHQSDRLAAEVRAAGAEGFVSKSQAFHDLVRAVDTVLAGGTFYGSPASPEKNPEKPKSNGLTFRRALRLAWQI